MHQLLPAQPFEQDRPVLGEDDPLQVGVDLALLLLAALADREQRLTRSPQNQRRSRAGSNAIFSSNRWVTS